MNLGDLRRSQSAVVSVADAASVLGVDVRTVSRAIECGDLPALKVGRRVLIPRLLLLARLGVDTERAEPETPTLVAALPHAFEVPWHEDGGSGASRHSRRSAGHVSDARHTSAVTGARPGRAPL